MPRGAGSEPAAIWITGPGIHLGAFLKHAQAVQSGGEAKQLIQSGLVRVNGNTESRRHHLVVHGDVVQLADGRAFVVAGDGHP